MRFYKKTYYVNRKNKKINEAEVWFGSPLINPKGEAEAEVNIVDSSHKNNIDLLSSGCYKIFTYTLEEVKSANTGMCSVGAAIYAQS